MKIRTNFVSNSSSSSFIVGYGVLKPETRNKCLNEIKNALGEPNSWADWHTSLANDIIEHEESNYIGFVEFYVDTEGMDSIDEVLLIHVANNEGDCGSPFFKPPLYESGWEQAEDPSFYNKDQQRVIEILASSDYIDRTKPNNWKIGAERNG